MKGITVEAATVDQITVHLKAWCDSEGEREDAARRYIISIMAVEDGGWCLPGRLSGLRGYSYAVLKER